MAATNRKDHETLVIGSRNSELAMVQTHWVRDRIASLDAPPAVTIITQLAEGDKILDKTLSQLATASPGIFTKELEVWLQSGAASIAVHSLKDVPTHLPDGLTLAAITERAAPEDAVVLSKACTSAGYKSLSDLPAGSLVGTSSLRREALLRRCYPDLAVLPVRGNLNTRIKKLDGEHDTCAASGAPHYHALVLARAGLERLGWGDRISQVLDPLEFPYGVSQGALGIEVRAADASSASVVLQACEHPVSAARCQAERAFLRGLQGGCQVPIGVQSSVDQIPAAIDHDDGPGTDTPSTAPGSSSGAAGSSAPSYSTHRLILRGTVLSRDGSEVVESSCEGVIGLPTDGAATPVGVPRDPPPAGTATHELHFNAAPRYWHEAAAIGEALAKQLLSMGAAKLLVHLGAHEVDEEAAKVAGAARGEEGCVEPPGGLGRPLTYGSAEGEAMAQPGTKDGLDTDEGTC